MSHGHWNRFRWSRFAVLALAVVLVATAAMPPQAGVAATPVDPGAADAVELAARPDAAAANAVQEDDEEQLAAQGLAGRRFAPGREWTDEELRSAKPKPVPVFDGPPSGVGAQDWAPIGPPVVIPPVLPGGRPVAAAGRDADDAPVSAQAIREVSALAQENFPEVAVGKLFFTQGGARYVCSAAAIGNNAIWTAAHCLHEGNNGGWSSNVVFAPGYRDGITSHGQWRGVYGIVPRAWMTRKNNFALPYDYGAAAVTNFGPASLETTVGGALGFAVNTPLRQSYSIYGFPSNRSNGQRLWNCTGPVRRVFIWLVFGPPTQGVDCSGLGSGMSGGPWLRNGAIVHGNTSYGITADGVPLLATPSLTDAALGTRNAAVAYRVPTVAIATLESLSLAPNPVRNPRGGGTVVTGTVHLRGRAPASGAVVTITSAGNARVVHPASVTVPAGQHQRDFQVRVLPCSGGSSCSKTFRASYAGKTVSRGLQITR